MFNKMKYALSAMAVFCVLLFAGCGAVVDTELTADGNFSGKRVMTLTLSNSDINDNITGGAAAIEKTVKKYIPKELTYTKSSTSDSLKYVFTLEFSDIEDYRTKVAAVFAANPDNKKEIDIKYENISSPFKMSASFKENFTSIDMMGWLTYGVRTDGISTYSSESDWYETGSTKLVWNGKEYSTGNTMSMSDSEYNCADSVTVETRLPINGTADRKIEFVFSKNTVDALNENGTVLDDYFSAFAGGNVLYRSETPDDGNDIACIIEMQGLSYEELAKKTAEVLLDENISFAVDVKKSSDENGQLDIEVSEKLDASSYLKKSEGNLRSSYYLPDGTEVKRTDADTVKPDSRKDDDENTYFTYRPGYSGEDVSVMTFSWIPQFESCAVKLGFSGDKVKLSLIMNADNSMYETALLLLKERLENSIAKNDGMSLSESQADGMTKYEVKLADKDAETAAESYKNFISYYTGMNASCDFSIEEAGNGTPFKKQTLYSAKINVSPLAGKNPVEFILDKPIGSSVYFIGDDPTDTEDDEPVYADRYIDVTILTEQVNVIGVILTIAAALLFAAFAVTVLANLKTWVSAGKAAGESAKAAAAKAAASRPAPAQNTAPTVALSDKNVSAEQNTKEEEDELI